MAATHELKNWATPGLCDSPASRRSPMKISYGRCLRGSKSCSARFQKTSGPGSVFSLARANGRKSVFTEEWVSNTVTKIGRTAGIVVATHPIRKTKKYASLHDLRRTFATWWARRMPATILRELMRQESVQTTEDYYVGINAQAMAIVLKAIDGPCPENIGVTNQLTLDRLPFTPLVET